MRKLPALDGHTLDISITGMALVVPAIRIGEHYLAGTDKRLSVQLELPDGPVKLVVVPVRYESFGEDDEEIGYLIGARIIEMSKEDRAVFEEYLTKVLKNQPARAN
jgi:hypothetical protein